MKFQVTISCHNMPCIELTDAPIEVMRELKAIVSCQYMNTPEYEVSKKAGAFLQGYEESYRWILIEFWLKNYQEFVDFINENVTA
jgi:hypothetical protein